jgi:predicted metal-dependent enzyme (double-stranded beta helix superfamily)
MSTTQLSPTIQTFIGDVKAIPAEHGETDSALDLIAGRMKRLLNEPDLTRDDVDPVQNGHRIPIPYSDESGLTLLRGWFGPDHKTPIHNHFTWGVVGLYQGRDRYQVWRRLDDGDGEGYAEVELAQEFIMEPGDVQIIPLPPQDIHVQQSMGEDVYELVILGANPMEGPRLHFDPDAKTAVDVRK